MSDFCTIKTLPADQMLAAARTATDINPANAPPPALNEAQFPTLLGLEPAQRIAVLTSKYWDSKGVDLTVGFMEAIADDLKARILSHMNACGTAGSPVRNIRFHWVARDPQVRITREGDGYWSYLGTDVLHIPAREPTMSLQAFTMQTPEAEYVRVVRHETLHTCGCPHEHMRKAIIDRLDEAKTIAWGRTALGWDEQTVRQQILTPLGEGSLTGQSPTADQDSIMCYRLPGSITKDGQPIRGGDDLNQTDRTYLAKLYPTDVIAPPVGGNCGSGPAVLAMLKAYNSIRKGDSMALTTDQSEAVTKASQAVMALPCASIFGILGPLIAALCPQNQPQAAICQNAGNLCGLLTKLPGLIEQLKPIIDAIMKACPQQGREPTT